jgi:hypothetical protein
LSEYYRSYFSVVADELVARVVWEYGGGADERQAYGCVWLVITMVLLNIMKNDIEVGYSENPPDVRCIWK